MKLIGGTEKIDAPFFIHCVDFSRTMSRAFNQHTELEENDLAPAAYGHTGSAHIDSVIVENEDGGMHCDMFLVRHAQRIDETDEGPRWRAENADRWFDPPLTDAGKRQSAAAAAQLLRYMNARDVGLGGASTGTAGGSRATPEIPFSCVYCSPLLRTLQTAVEFGRVFGLPVVPVAGLATCTAAFKKHGAQMCTLLPVEAARRQCDTDVAIDTYSLEYPSMARDEMDSFRLTCELIALAECERRGHGGAPSAHGTSCTGPAALVVTHREGLRDMSLIARRKFQRTAYCSCAVFSCSTGTQCAGTHASAPSSSGSSGSSGGSGGRGGSTSNSGSANAHRLCSWSLHLDPAQYDQRAQEAVALDAADVTRCSTDSRGMEAHKSDEATVVDRHAEGDESTTAPIPGNE